MAAPTPKQRATTLKRQGLDDSVIGAILGLSADDVRALLVEADPDVTLGGDQVGEQVVKLAQRVLTDAEIKALPTQSIEVGPAIPGDHIWVPIACVLVFFTLDAEYTNIDLNEAALTVDGFELLGPANPSFGYDGLYDFLAGGFDPLVITMRPNFENGSVDGARVKTQVQTIGDFDDENPGTFTPRISVSNGFLDDLTGGHPDNRLSVSISYMEITP